VRTRISTRNCAHLRILTTLPAGPGVLQVCALSISHRSFLFLRAPDAEDGARLRRALALPGRAVAAAGAARRARAVAIADEITVAITVDLLHFV
jgi:hypothetical protein